MSANYLNGLAIALIAVAGFAPVASFASGSTDTSSLVLALMFVGASGGSGYLHHKARQMFERLQND